MPLSTARLICLCSVTLLLVPGRLPAQTPTPAPTQTTVREALPLFRAKLPGGAYEVAVRSIVAVSSHEYMVDGVARVTEVNVDTAGSLLARFYYIEPAAPKTPLGIGTATLEKAQQLLSEAADRSGQNVWQKVVKSYPLTTHARTVEFRLETKDQLNKIYEAAEESFRMQKSKVVSVE